MISPAITVKMESCSICIEDFENLFTLKCKHGFCKKCIGKLVVYSIKCPLCRKTMSPMEISKIKPKPFTVTWFYMENGASVTLREPLASIMELAFKHQKAHLLGQFRWHELIVDTVDMVVLKPRTYVVLGELNRLEMMPVLINKYRMFIQEDYL